MNKKQKMQFIDAADRMFNYAIRLEKNDIADPDVIAAAMLHTVVFYATHRSGKSGAAEWISDNVNLALMGLKNV